MKLLLIGSTGRTGKELVSQALSQGHSVTAFARNPSKLGIAHESLRVVQGDVLHSPDVENAVKGHDAVLVSIGADTAKTTLREDATRNIVNAMEQSGVRRLVVQSVLGIGQSWQNLSLFTRCVASTFLRHAFADHAKQEAVIESSDLDWVIVRPPRLTEMRATGAYRHGYDVSDRAISRCDVAAFMLQCVSDDTYLKQTPGISS
jgi:putative NADH-flavin reductase